MDNKEFFAAFDDLCKEKGIGREEFIETLKNALNSAYKKQYDDGSEVFVDIDPEKGIFECNAVQKVVAEVTDRDREISVEEAQAINPEYREGDEIVRTFVPQDFGRIAAQTARQVILQKLREKERDNTFSAISDKEGELMEATVRKIDDKNVYVDFADRKIEGVMLPQDQSPTEKYEPNDVIQSICEAREERRQKFFRCLYLVRRRGWQKSCSNSRCRKSRRGLWKSNPSPARQGTERRWRFTLPIPAWTRWARA